MCREIVEILEKMGDNINMLEQMEKELQDMILRIGNKSDFFYFNYFSIGLGNLFLGYDRLRERFFKGVDEKKRCGALKRAEKNRKNVNQGI